MKKSILLNEDEKNRILNLHETAKNLYENKKPVSSIKETNTKKEDMKKVIKLTESDLERIVKRVIEEQYMGVAFGGEQNGLKIKKMETKEQAVGAPVSTQSNVAAKPKVDQAIITKIQNSFPKPSKDTQTNKMVFSRGEDSSKYDSVINFLKNTRLGTLYKVVDLSQVTPDTPNATEIVNTGNKQNSDAISTLYSGIQSVMDRGFAKAMEDQRIKALGLTGDAARTAAAEYLEKIGVKYNS